MNYSINIISPPDYAHSATFDELALGLQGGFAELGHDVPILRFPQQEPQGRGIFLGTNILCAYPDWQLPPDAIIFNLEQVTNASTWMPEYYFDLLRTHEVWDYSKANIARLLQRGIDARYCGIGYADALTRIEPTTEDIDVLFYGSIFGRRIPILEAIEATGLNVKRLFGVYGLERDAWIARSKIVLNLHAYDTTIFEIVRCSYLWANKKCIVSEPSIEIPEGMEESLIVGYADELPEICQDFVIIDSHRTIMANRGHEQFKLLRQSEYLKAVL